MKLTIIPVDKAVYKDNFCYGNLDFSSCGIPSNVHALQWQDNSGWIEDVSPLVQNLGITELPSWANTCLAKWQEAYDAEQAAILAAQQEQQAG
jgi:hypothetical protein